MTTTEIYDNLKATELNTHSYSLGPTITNPEKAIAYNRRVVGIIYTDKGDQILDCKTPDIRLVDGFFTHTIDDADKPFAVESFNGTYLCHAIRYVEFINKEVDDYLNSLNNPDITYNDLLNALINKTKAFLSKKVGTN